MSGRLGRLVVVAFVALAALCLASRRWHRSWGTAAEEATVHCQAMTLISSPALQTTRSIEIHAQPEGVWPWLVQMGQGRGGFYTYEWIENQLGAESDYRGSLAQAIEQLDSHRLVEDTEALGDASARYFLALRPRACPDALPT